MGLSTGKERTVDPAGDRAAFAAFLARYERRIARVVRALVPPAEAEDVFQEVCLRLLVKGALYDPSRPLEPWLDAVTRRVCAAAGRRAARRRRERGPLSVEPPAPAPASGDPFVLDAVRDYLAGRPATERRALRLVLLTGMTQREAAKQLGVPPGTVASWLARGVRALRERLGGPELGGAR